VSLRGAEEKDGNVSGSESFPAACRLTRRRQFLAVYNKGHRTGTFSFTLFGLPSPNGPRLGITVTKKVGNAVRRNRIKRRFREIFRKNRHLLDAKLDLVINAHRGIDASQYRSLEEEFLVSFRRLARGYRM